MTTILAPIDLADTSRVGRRLWRKQVLKKGSIDYKGRRITFDDAYLTDLAASFNDGAFDQVAFQLADSANTHTLDPERTRGEVKGFEVTPDGLDALIETTDEGEQVLTANPRLGVSVRIKEGLTRADGKSFRRAIHHVLGTLDPRVTGLNPWQPADVTLSADDDDEVVDLSAAHYQGETMQIDLSTEQVSVLREVLDLATAATLDPPTSRVMPDTDPDEVDDEPVFTDPPADALDELSDEELAELDAAEIFEELLESGPDDTVTDPDDLPTEDDDAEDADDADADADGGADLANDDPGEGDDDPGDEIDEISLSDDDINAMLDAAMADAGTPDGDNTAAWLDFAAENGLVDAGYTDLAAAERTARAEAAKARFDVQARDWVDAGVPPFAVDLAGELLGTDPATVDLSNTDGPDARQIVTSLLDMLKGSVDLAAETGHGNPGTGPVKDENDLTEAWAAFLANN